MTWIRKPRRGRRRLRSTVGTLALLAGLAACAAPPPPQTPIPTAAAELPPLVRAVPLEPHLPAREVASFAQEGLASWYGGRFHRRHTASGEHFDMKELTAAHRSLPLDTVVRVTNLANNRTALVRINDRGPFARGRIIDISHSAALQLGMAKAGVAQVRIEVYDSDQSRRVAEAAPGD
ncbi:MAG TPA: septal ring lytic transglycosylase RlpA family protein [Stellaceae bacterium]|nr:septal ring lytic transglycosylase RlpA family protein [Stellaceae bacterium]